MTERPAALGVVAAMGSAVTSVRMLQVRKVAHNNRGHRTTRQSLVTKAHIHARIAAIRATRSPGRSMYSHSESGHSAGRISNCVRSEVCSAPRMRWFAASKSAARFLALLVASSLLLFSLRLAWIAFTTPIELEIREGSI